MKAMAFVLAIALLAVFAPCGNIGMANPEISGKADAFIDAPYLDLSSNARFPIRVIAKEWNWPGGKDAILMLKVNLGVLEQINGQEVRARMYSGGYSNIKVKYEDIGKEFKVDFGYGQQYFKRYGLNGKKCVISCKVLLYCESKSAEIANVERRFQISSAKIMIANAQVNCEGNDAEFVANLEILDARAIKDLRIDLSLNFLAFGNSLRTNCGAQTYKLNPKNNPSYFRVCFCIPEKWAKYPDAQLQYFMVAYCITDKMVQFRDIAYNIVFLKKKKT